MSDDGSCDDSLFYDIEESSHKREYKNPDEALYGQESFVSNVLIEKILNIGKITSTDNDNHKPKRRQKQLSSLRKKDVRSTNIRMANAHIQNGNLTVTNSKRDDPILKDSEGYNLSSFEGLTFDQGWGRRNDRNEGTLYGDSYIDPYKTHLKEYFDEGVKNSSRKMNPGMMREQLKTEFPNVFSLPGETEIKKYISQLFSNSKKSSRGDIDNDRTYNNTGDNLNNWIHILREIIENEITKKPEEIYKELTDTMQFRHNISSDSLPPKLEIKKKITYMKRVVKVRARRAIV